MSRRVTAIFLLVFFAFSFIISYEYFSGLSKRADAQRLENYIRRYLEEYDNLVHVWGNESEFEFFEGYPYQVLGVVSEVHGAAIFFTRSSEQEIEIIIYPKRIEFYLWPEMQQWWNNATTYFKVAEDEVGIFLDDYTIEVSPGGHVEIDGVLIYENRMILKGSNNEKSWLPEVAMMDATNEFLRMAKDIVLTEAEMKEVQGVALLRAKYEEIARNEETGVYANNQWLRAKHEEEFWDLVEECEIRSDTAKLIKSHALSIYKEQPVFQLNPSSIINGLITSSISTVTLSILKLVYDRKIKRSPEKKTEKRKPRKKKLQKPHVKLTLV